MRSNDYIVAVIETIKESELAKKQLEEKIEELKNKLKDELEARKTEEMHIKGWVVKTTRTETNSFDTKAFKKDFDKLYEQYCSPRIGSRFYILKEGR